MTTTIYDYANRPVEVELPDKPIAAILVTIFSGDETGIVTFEDGTSLRFDASDKRLMSFYDGSYIITGANIKTWLEFKPSKYIAAAYERYGCFRDDANNE